MSGRLFALHDAQFGPRRFEVAERGADLAAFPLPPQGGVDAGSLQDRGRRHASHFTVAFKLSDQVRHGSIMPH